MRNPFFRVSAYLFGEVVLRSHAYRLEAGKRRIFYYGKANTGSTCGPVPGVVLEQGRLTIYRLID
jgi:hypothetical protein